MYGWLIVAAAAIVSVAASNVFPLLLGVVIALFTNGFVAKRSAYAALDRRLASGDIDAAAYKAERRKIDHRYDSSGSAG